MLLVLSHCLREEHWGILFSAYVHRRGGRGYNVGDMSKVVIVVVFVSVVGWIEPAIETVRDREA